jgi:methylated-DNA-[protein]-cysteine S-methyltransferase
MAHCLDMEISGFDGLRLRLIASDSGLRRVEFAGNCAGVPEAPVPLLVDAERQLRAYFAGRLHRFDLPLEMEGTEFQKRVWRALLAIPYGETRSYGQVAAAIGDLKAVRAVGTANGANPIAIVVPCHRVIGAGGALTGYAGGLTLKRKLLELEARYAWKSREAASA